MFSGCSSLSDIKGLEKWNVSNGNNFQGMFSYFSSLLDIKGLEKWNVSKTLLKYIKWNQIILKIKKIIIL